MNKRVTTTLRWLGLEALILALWLAGPVRGGADPGTTLVVLFITHAYPIAQRLERLAERVNR